ncbi:MAG: DNA (cytosine-5-)-methyltransferase [Spirochaetales bacterium]|nr:DNA (cytosine-5-)-methyltransferase [Spirochaetales bacterium]
MKRLTVGSMFAGIGGIDIGFEQAGFKVKWANEFNTKSCETFRNYENFRDIKLFEKDVHDLKTCEVESVDIITSGFPCQAFSVAGYRQGFDDEKGRGNLFFETARFINDLKPKAYLLENVRNLAGHDNGKTLEVIKYNLVDKLGYSFIPFILNSKDYGNIPQTRERIYIVGFRNEADIDYDYDKKELNSESATRSFEIPDPIPLEKNIHDCIYHKKQDEKYYYKKEHQYYPILESEMKRRDTIYQWRRVYVRENKSNLCPTLTANMGAGGHNVPLIIDDYGIRKLTPKECLNFQGYPENYHFPEKMANSHSYMQAGNSVVIPVIKRIANAIREALNAQ